MPRLLLLALTVAILAASCDSEMAPTPAALPDGPVLVVAYDDSLFAHPIRADGDDVQVFLGDLQIYSDLRQSNRLVREQRLTYPFQDLTTVGFPRQWFLDIPSQDLSAPRVLGVDGAPFYQGTISEQGGLFAVIRDEAVCGGWAVAGIETGNPPRCLPTIPDDSVIQQLHVSDDERFAAVAYFAVGDPVFSPMDVVVIALDDGESATRTSEALVVLLSGIAFHLGTGAVYIATADFSGILGLSQDANEWRRAYEFDSGRRRSRRLLLDGDRLITYDLDLAAGTSTVLILDVSQGPDAVRVTDRFDLPFFIVHQYLHGRYLVFRSYLPGEPETQFAGFCLDDPEREIRTRTVTLPLFALDTAGFSHSMTCAEGL